MLNVTTSNNSNVPRIVHQIAPKDTSKWHHFWFACQQSWLEHFKGFEYKLWNDREDIDNLVYQYYPEFKNLYNSFPVQIMKIDFVRLCFLHKYGGIYGDMDYFVYKNFYDQLDKDIGFLENLTEEYTSARYENSLMYSAPGNPLLYELMKYTKTCFIQSKNLFKKNNEKWRNEDNDALINNTTGSGMISAALDYFKKYFSFQALNCKTFNNRPASYDKSFYGKHVHTSIWGNEYSGMKPSHLLIVNGMMYQIYNDDVNDSNVNRLYNDINDPYELVKTIDFDMYKDYTNQMFLRDDNLEELKLVFKKTYL